MKSYKDIDRGLLKALPNPRPSMWWSSAPAPGAPPPAFDMPPFRLGRFFDGTRLKAGQAM